MKLSLTSMLLLIGVGTLLLFNSCTKENLEVPQNQIITEITSTENATAFKAPSGYIRVRLTGDQVVPPVSTQALGQGFFQIVDLPVVDNNGEQGLSYIVNGRNLSGITSVELALASEGQNGPTIAMLDLALLDTDGNPLTKTISEGVLTASQLMGSMEGNFQDLKQAIRNGEVYVLIRTTSFPDGEIRTQL